MGVSKKYCKCGHEKSQHKPKNKKLYIGSFCHECPCSSYLNRKFPNKASYAFMIASICFSAVILITSLIIITEANPELTGIQDEPITFTLGELHEIMVLVFLLINICVIFALVIDPIFSVILEKKRKQFPIDDKDG